MKMNNCNDVITNMYQSIIEVEPISDSVVIHKISEDMMKYDFDTDSASGFVSSLLSLYFSNAYSEQLSNFLNIAQFAETNKFRKYSEIEAKTVDSLWHRICVIPQNGEEEQTFFICIQNIQTVKGAEEKHNDMINAMSHVYDALFFIDMEKNLLGLINSKEGFYKPKGRLNNAKETISHYINTEIRDDYSADFASFANLDALPTILSDKDVVSCEYRGIDNEWYWGQFICAVRNGGKCTNALWGIRNISIDKKNTETKEEVIRSLTSEYRNIFSVSLKNGEVDIFRLDEKSKDKFKSTLSLKGYDEIAGDFIYNYVMEEDRGLFGEFGTISSLRITLKNSLNSRVTYRIKADDNSVHYYEARFVKSAEDEDIFIIAIKNVDNKIALQNEVKRGYDAYVTLHKLIKSGMWNQFFDDDGKPGRMAWSEEFRKMIGYDNPEEFPDQYECFFNILHEEDKERVITGINGAIHDLSGATLFDETFRLHTKNRGIRWFRATGDVSRNVDGKPYCFYGVFLDVTDQYERESLEKERIAALNEASAYQDSMNAIHGAMNSGKWSMYFDEKGEYDSVVWSDDFRRMLGYENETDFPNIKESFLNIIHKDDFRNAYAFFMDSFSYEKEDFVYNLDYRVLTKDKGYCWFQVVAKVSFNENRLPKTIYGLLLNVDDKKKNELLVEEQHNIVDAISRDFTEIQLLDLSSDRSIVIKKGGVMNEIGDNTVHKYSLEWNRIIDNYAFPEDVYEIQESISAERVLRELSYKDEYSANIRLNIKGEHHYQIKYTKLNKVAHDGCYVVSGIRCIDDIIANERDQKILLKNALASAERANKAKTVFLNSMSHDIRTPMNAIVGFAALASTHIDNQNQVRDYLEKIKVSSNHLLSLINDVLDMSRIESGKVKIDAKEVHLPDALHDIRSIIQSDITAKRLELQIDCIDVVNEDVVCDKLRLNQVLLNLVSNSIKFTPAGGTITIKVIEKTSLVNNRANFEFVVKDTGIGMSKEFAEHIFEPFSREETSTVSGIQGTGLGMAITKNIVDMMHGTINVKSTPNEGTEFVVALSFDVCSKKETVKPIEELMDVKALVADDDMDACFGISKLLTSLGLKAEWTTSGKEAVARTKYAITENDQYGVYIFDWLMPDMNGLEVVRRIKKDIKEDAKIIIMSSYDWTDIENEAMEAGVTAFCSKPVFMSELREILAGDRNSVAEKTASEDYTDFAGRRILIVEDNELNREIAVGILETVGFETETAADGNIAVEMLSKAKPGYYDLVLMDIQMPTMNGYEATKCIREMVNEEIRNIPIIAMTANAFEEDRKKALSVGMNGHVAKPFETKALFKTIRTFIK